MADIDELLCNCIYFTSNKLSRIIGKIAEEEFKITGISPTYAFLVTIVNKKPGVSQKEIGEVLHMTPSTITRFIDKLESKELLKRKIDGKNSFIYSTEKGQEVQAHIDKAWGNLHDRYSKMLGCKEEKKIAAELNEIGKKLEGII